MTIQSNICQKKIKLNAIIQILCKIFLQRIHFQSLLLSAYPCGIIMEPKTISKVCTSSSTTRVLQKIKPTIFLSFLKTYHLSYYTIMIIILTQYSWLLHNLIDFVYTQPGRHHHTPQRLVSPTIPLKAFSLEEPTIFFLLSQSMHIPFVLSNPSHQC